MRLNGEQFIKHGSVDTSGLLPHLLAIKDSEISKLSDRAKIYSSQSSTDTIELCWTPSVFNNEQVFYVYNNKQIQNTQIGLASQGLFEQVTKLIPGKIIKAGIVRMYPGKTIPFHIDGAHPGWTSTHRVHLPIITEQAVEFLYTNTRQHLPVNVLTEINNDIPHSVIHNGKNLRYHLMFDILPTNYAGPYTVVEHSDSELYRQQRTMEAQKKVRV